VISAVAIICIMNITPDLPFLNIHNPFTNESISVYLDKHSCMSLDTKNFFVKQVSHLSKGVVIVGLTFEGLLLQLVDPVLLRVQHLLPLEQVLRILTPLHQLLLTNCQVPEGKRFGVL